MKLALGTVQFGMDYGVSNPKGKVPFEEVVHILDFAWKNGIDTLDTAVAYGDSELVLGEAIKQLPDASFKVVTKLPKLEAEAWSTSSLEDIKQQFAQSLSRLGKGNVYGLLLHDANDLLKPGAKTLYDWLLDLKKQGQVKKIGVSVYDPEKTQQLVEQFDFDLVQLPLNVFDQRFVSSGCVEQLYVKGVEVHVRSILLQGVLAMSTEGLPFYLQPLLPKLEKLTDLTESLGVERLSIPFAFVEQVGKVQSVLLGVTSKAELRQALQAFYQRCEVLDQGCDIDWQSFSEEDERLILPTHWEQT